MDRGILLQAWEIKVIYVKVGGQGNAWLRHSHVAESSQGILISTEELCPF